MRLRPASPADIPALLALEERVFPSDRLSRRQFFYHLRNPLAAMIVCANGGVILGYTLMLRRGAAARLYSIAVDPAAQGRGIGSRLMKAVIKRARAESCTKIGLEVRARSPKVIALYEKHGFTRAAALPAYYGDGADGVRMVRHLK